MKPVNLLPSGDGPTVAVAVGGGDKASVGKIGGIAAGAVAVVAVAGYFAFARVDSVRSETTQLQGQAASATQETTAVRSRISSLGQPVVDSDKQLAQGQEQVLVSAYSERHDFPRLARELRDIMQDTGGWYTTIDVSLVTSSTSGAGSGPVRTATISGYVPSDLTMAGFNERVNATASLKDADTVSVTSIKKLVHGTVRMYWKFTVTADLVDKVAPEVDPTDGEPDPVTGLVPGAAPGATVSAGGSDDALHLSLEPTASTRKPAASPTKSAAPANPFATAAAAAGKGAGS